MITLGSLAGRGADAPKIVRDEDITRCYYFLYCLDIFIIYIYKYILDR